MFFLNHRLYICERILYIQIICKSTYRNIVDNDDTLVRIILSEDIVFVKNIGTNTNRLRADCIDLEYRTVSVCIVHEGTVHKGGQVVQLRHNDIERRPYLCDQSRCV